MCIGKPPRSQLSSRDTKCRFTSIIRARRKSNCSSYASDHCSCWFNENKKKEKEERKKTHVKKICRWFDNWSVLNFRKYHFKSIEFVYYFDPQTFIFYQFFVPYNYIFYTNDVNVIKDKQKNWNDWKRLKKKEKRRKEKTIDEEKKLKLQLLLQ